jgi:hypothetical protein
MSGAKYRSDEPWWNAAELVVAVYQQPGDTGSYSVHLGSERFDCRSVTAGARLAASHLRANFLSFLLQLERDRTSARATSCRNEPLT